MPTQLELDTTLLANLYGVEPEEVLQVAVRNLLITAAFQIGKEGRDRKYLDKLLLAPSLGETEKEREPTSDAEREVLEAASKMEKPFKSSDLDLKSISARQAGIILSSWRWPSRGTGAGGLRVWLPRGDSVTVGMESK